MSQQGFVQVITTFFNCSVPLLVLKGFLSQILERQRAGAPSYLANVEGAQAIWDGFYTYT